VSTPPQDAPAPRAGRTPLWLLAASVVLVIAAVLALLAAFGGASLPERTGPPVEELAVERTVLAPGTIAVTVRNTGPDPVQVAQVVVNDAFVDFAGADAPVERLGTQTLVLRYPWETGQPYLLSLMTSTGLVVEHEIPVAVQTPVPDGSFFGLMTLLGVYVGVVPVLLGMLVLPVLRRVGRGVVRALLAVTVGLLAFLAVDAVLEGFELAAGAGAGFGGPLVVLLGAALAFLVLTAVDRTLSHGAGASAQRSGLRLALLIAIGIGLHNLGEGLAIGSAYAVGELALGTALVVGFALHNTTEGLAIVAPLTERKHSLLVLALLGLLAGAPAIAGAIIGATVDNATLAALLLGVGAGAVVQVVVQIAPALRGGTGRAVDAVALGGVAAGVLVMYATGLLVAA
jgi:zinc transporter, ZIP family